MMEVIATKATLEFLRSYSQFGDSHKMRVGDTVRIRDEHVEWVRSQMLEITGLYYANALHASH